MNELIYFMGSILLTIFYLSIFVGIFLVLLYVLLNAYSNSRSFTKISHKIRRIIFFLIDFCGTWGANLIIFFLVGKMLLSLLSMIK